MMKVVVFSIQRVASNVDVHERKQYVSPVSISRGTMYSHVEYKSYTSHLHLSITP